MQSKQLPIDWTPIRHVVLDFGGVLYKINHEATANAFSKLGLNHFNSLYSHEAQSSLMDDLECGRATQDEFILTLKNRCHPNTTVDEVTKAWNAVLIGLRPNLLPLLHRLANQFDLILFSNTNALHAAHFEKQILHEYGKAFQEPFRQIIYSHRLGHRKPDLKAYQEVERQFGLNPKATLFIDDTPSNIHGASNAGWTAIHHQPEHISLQDLLVQLGLNNLSSPEV